MPGKWLAWLWVLGAGLWGGLLSPGAAFAGDPANAAANAGNRLAHLDEFCDPYHVGRHFPKLITPQWVGEEGVEAVVVLAIDDMRGHERWEAYLRPIIDRLKQIDGRAPVSIMTCQVDPQEPHLQTWLREGLSIEVHTIDHPCPCLQGGSLARAAKTYHDCVDLLARIPGNRPVAFRMPCCDSRNTPSPRFWSEIFNATSAAGNFLEIDTSVFNIITPADDSLPRELTATDDGESRFRRYLPFPNFVNTIEDYPYPYVIGRLCWQFPCVVPSDWSAQHVQRPNNPQTVEDLRRALDATVLKQGVYNLVFHPHGWIRNDQVVELIDHAHERHGKKVKFLNFRECAERLQEHLLAGQPLRAADGGDNGVRLLDVDGDGYQDVVIGNAARRMTRLWLPAAGRWRESGFPTVLVEPRAAGRGDAGVRFGVVQASGQASCLVRSAGTTGGWHFVDGQWRPADELAQQLAVAGEPLFTARDGVDQGVRLRDLDGDGRCELIAGSARQRGVWRWDVAASAWRPLDFALPDDMRIVDEAGRDAGLRWFDLDGDGRLDVVFANERRWDAALFTSLTEGWSRRAGGDQVAEQSIPPIVRAGANNGAWFHSGHLWVQNEDTDRLADGVARLPLRQIVAWIAAPADADGAGLPPPKSPEQSLAAMTVRPGLKVELVAAEPLVVDPIAFDWGPDGRLWVVEMGDYPLGLDGRGQPGGRVKALVDTTGDGRYDQATVFLDNLPFPTGVKVWREGVLITAAPRILWAQDTTGDGRADRVETLYEGFGKGNQQHRVNGLRYGLDHWLYVANGDSGGKIRSLLTNASVELRQHDLRIQPDAGLLEAISGRTQFGLNRDDWGNWLGGNNSNPAWHYVLDQQLLARNPHFIPPAARRDISVTPGAARVYPLSTTHERFNNPGSANHFTSACSPEFYRDRALGDEFYGNVFVCEPVHNLVHREVVSPTGVTFTSRRAADEQTSEFLASSDNWFRPAMVRTGPDGALWIADMYRLVIEHPEWISRDWQRRLDLRAGDDRGRIYRIVPAQGGPLRVPRLDGLDAAGRVAALESPNGVVRDLAQQLLCWSGDRQAVAPLARMCRDGATPLARLHALCTLDALGELTPALVLAGLGDEHPGVRRHAVRLSQAFVNEADELAAAIAKLADDADPLVRLEVAYRVGHWRDAATAAAVLAKLLARDDADDYQRAAAFSSLTEQNAGQVLGEFLARTPDPAPAVMGPLLTQAAAFGAGDATLAAVRMLVEPGPNQRFSAAQMSSAAALLAQLERGAARRDLAEQARQQLRPLFAAARAELADERAPVEMRMAALGLLRRATADDRPAEATLLELLRPLHPPVLQSAALATFLAQATDPSLDELFSAWRSYTPALRVEIVDACLPHERLSQRLLAAVAGEVVPVRQFDAHRRRQLLEHRAADVRAEAARLFGASQSSSRSQLIQQYTAELAQRTADVGRGREVFGQRCVACHRLEEKGAHVGPDLAALSNRSVEALLVAILDPNRAVEDKFLSYAAITRDGRVLSGMLAGESGGSLTLQTADGKTLEVLRKDLDELASTDKSFMPEGFEQDIPPPAMADLVAYLRGVGAPPKKFAGNEPAVVQADGDGVLHLAATTARVYGDSLVFESEYKNLGWWGSENDRAEWSLQVARPGRYRVAIDYACQHDSAGNRFRLELGATAIEGQVSGTGTWDDYRWREIGELQLAAGEHELVFRSAGSIRRALIDLREVRLTPLP